MSSMSKAYLSLAEAWQRLGPLLEKLFVDRFKDISIPDWMNYTAFVGRLPATCERVNVRAGLLGSTALSRPRPPHTTSRAQPTVARHVS